ncbi:ABC transporter ATP-binding protein [Micrococcales bacterium 31B]|nr:ABC transporter ATP-binding protein [Micrococcales bacterium 31B]
MSPRAEKKQRPGKAPVKQHEDVEDVEKPTVEAGDFGDDMFGMGQGRKAQNFWPSCKRLFGLLTPERPALVVVFLTSIIAVVLNVIAPKIMGHATDILFGGVIGQSMPSTVTREQVIQLAEQQNGNQADMLRNMDFTPGQGIDFTALGEVIILVLVIYAISSLFSWISGRLLNDVVMRRVKFLRDLTESKLNRLPLNYFDTAKRGDVLSRVTNDIDNVQTALQQAFSQLISSVLTVIGIGIMMFYVSWQLALIALIAIPLTAVGAGLVAKKSQVLFKRQWKAVGDLNAQVEESFSGHELVKVFGREAEMQEGFAQKNEKLFEAAAGAQFMSGMIMPIVTFVNNLSYVAVAVAGGIKVASGTMSIGDVQAFIQYSREFNQPLGQIGGMMNQLQSGVASAERVFEFLDADEQVPDAAVAALPADPHGLVRFENVSFSYVPEQKLIEDLTFEARPGSTVAIVGPTGAGKTTLVNLVMRFYELNSGRITLDGVDITQIERSALRSKVGMVLQDAWLFGGSIFDNIRYGNLDATDEQVYEAARATHVDRFVQSLPEGYDTVIDEEGTNVSVGEKQLITIARAFVADPSLLILDEATSSVDTRTEILVQKAMAALREDRTSFVIAHRLSTIRDADVILVMENGSIVEQGNHEELLEAKGAYYRLYQSQFQGAAVDIDAEEAATTTGLIPALAAAEASTATGGTPVAGAHEADPAE